MGGDDATPFWKSHLNGNLGENLEDFVLLNSMATTCYSLGCLQISGFS